MFRARTNPYLHTQPPLNLPDIVSAGVKTMQSFRIKERNELEMCESYTNIVISEIQFPDMSSANTPEEAAVPKDESPPKKRRGRPRKVQPDAEGKQNSVTQTSTDGEKSIPKVSEPVRRQRKVSKLQNQSGSDFEISCGHDGESSEPTTDIIQAAKEPETISVPDKLPNFKHVPITVNPMRETTRETIGSGKRKMNVQTDNDTSDAAKAAAIERTEKKTLILQALKEFRKEHGFIGFSELGSKSGVGEENVWRIYEQKRVPLKVWELVGVALGVEV